MNNSAAQVSGVNDERSSCAQTAFFDDDGDYQSVADLIRGLQNRELLVHARVPDGTDFRYGISPSAGALLRSTEAWQTAAEEHGDGPELIFFCDTLTWAESSLLNKLQGRDSEDLELVFVRKNDSIIRCCEDGRVETSNGRVISYELCAIADHEDPLFRSLPAGVERGDWFTNREQEVVAVIPSSDALLASANRPQRQKRP